MVKVSIKLDKELYEALSQILKHLETLVNYLENVEIQVEEEKT